MENEIQAILDLIENNLMDSDLNVQSIAKNMALSESQFRDFFKAVLGISAMEYIRKRRLSVAALLLMQDFSTLTVAEKLGYKNIESFERAFKNFHGATPGKIRTKKAGAKFYHRIAMRLIKTGGNVMDFQIVTKPKITLCGFSRKMEGHPAYRFEQVHCFAEESRKEQEILENFSEYKTNDVKIIYGIIKDADNNGFTYYTGYDCGGKNIESFEQIEIEEQKFLVFQTERCRQPVEKLVELRKQIEEDWLPVSGYKIQKSPEVEKYYWYNPHSDKRYSRYIEIWLPIK